MKQHPSAKVGIAIFLLSICGVAFGHCDSLDGPVVQAARTALDTGDVARVLSDSYGIMCRTGHHCAQPLIDAFTTHDVLRISAYVYNTEEEIAAFFSALDDVHAAFRP